MGPFATAFNVRRKGLRITELEERFFDFPSFLGGTSSFQSSCGYCREESVSLPVVLFLWGFAVESNGGLG